MERRRKQIRSELPPLAAACLGQRSMAICFLFLLSDHMFPNCEVEEELLLVTLCEAEMCLNGWSHIFQGFVWRGTQRWDNPCALLGSAM